MHLRVGNGGDAACSFAVCESWESDACLNLRKLKRFRFDWSSGASWALDASNRGSVDATLLVAPRETTESRDLPGGDWVMTEASFVRPLEDVASKLPVLSQAGLIELG